MKERGFLSHKLEEYGEWEYWNEQGESGAPPQE